MTSEITDHYSFGGLRERIQAGLDLLNVAPTVDVLGAVDEFHVGGRTATAHLVDQLGLTAGQRVLDIGSGLGGTARYLAASCQAHVTGVDLTKEYVEVARWLTDLVGLSEQIEFVHGSAAELAAPERPFAAATLVHVGMNIDDKAQVFTDVASQIASDGVFGIYDLMVTGEQDPDYPVPWASTPSTSFLETPDDYVRHLAAAGFTDIRVQDRTATALAAFDGLASASADGPPPLGLHLVMGPQAPSKFANLVAAVRAGVIAPTEIVAHRLDS